MDANEFLERLRELRSALFSQAVNAFFATQDAQTRAKFVGLRTQVMHLVDSLETTELDEIANALAANEQEIRNAIEELEDAIEDLDEAVKIISALGKIIGVIGQVVSVVV